MRPSCGSLSALAALARARGTQAVDRLVKLPDQFEISALRLGIFLRALPPAESCRVNASLNADLADGSSGLAGAQLDIGDDGVLVHAVGGNS